VEGKSCLKEIANMLENLHKLVFVLRLPGMDATPDCNAMLDAVTGNDLEIGFEDLFNRAEDRPEEKFQSVNSKMEAKFGII